MSIFGTPLVSFTGGSAFSPVTSNAINVPSGAMICFLAVAPTVDTPVVVTDSSSNVYASTTLISDGTDDYQFGYTFGAPANAALVVTANWQPNSGTALLYVWVVPITGGTPIFDVLFLEGALVSAGLSNTASANTSGTDEIAFCGIYDRNGVGGWSATPPMILETSSFQNVRQAGAYTTYSSPQTGAVLGISTAGSPAGGIVGVAFKAGASLSNIVAAMAGAGSLSGTLSGTGSLAAVLAGHGSVVANLTTFISPNLVAAMAGTGSLSATLSASASLAAAMAGQGSLIGNLTGEVVVSLACAMAGRGSMGVFSSNPVGSQPSQYILREFGVTLSNPAYLDTNSNTLQLFHQPSFLPNVNAGSVLPPRWSTPGTPDNQGFQGRVQAPGELLVAPDNLRLSGKVYTVTAQGMVFIPASAVSPTVNIILSQNYFGFGQAQVIDTLFTLVSPTALVPGTMNSWTLIATLAGNGVGTPVVSCAGRLWIGGTQYYGSGYSINPPQTISGHSRPSRHREPIIQLSLGVQFGGTISGPDLFQAYLTKFEMSYNKGNF